MRTFAALVLAAALGGCGYRVGDVKPKYLSAVHTIAVPTFSNRTFLPRIEALTTDTVIKQLQQDGTFRITNEDKADAVLKGEIRSVVRAPLRSLRGNALATTEFNLTLIRPLYLDRPRRESAHRTGRHRRIDQLLCRPGYRD